MPKVLLVIWLKSTPLLSEGWTTPRNASHSLTSNDIIAENGRVLNIFDFFSSDTKHNTHIHTHTFKHKQRRLGVFIRQFSHSVEERFKHMVDQIPLEESNYMVIGTPTFLEWR